VRAQIRATGATSTQPDRRIRNENHYAVVDSIKSGPAIGAAIGQEIGQANDQQAVYFIRVRFDDRSHRTVTQSSLDGLRIGDSVRIEDDRVRRY